MADTYGDALGKALIEEAKRRLFHDSQPRIHKCFAQLTDEEIWRRPNAETVSMGNLVLHLCGNVRQNIVAAIGGAPDLRQRSKEFDERGPIPKAQLLGLLDETMAAAKDALDRMDPHSFLETHRVQVYTETALSIVVHVVEHFSYHVGQITWYTKALKAVDMGYYGGVDLDVTN